MKDFLGHHKCTASHYIIDDTRSAVSSVLYFDQRYQSLFKSSQMRLMITDQQCKLTQCYKPSIHISPSIVLFCGKYQWRPFLCEISCVHMHIVCNHFKNMHQKVSLRIIMLIYDKSCESICSYMTIVILHSNRGSFPLLVLLCYIKSNEEVSCPVQLHRCA